jgi:hypothetical protein
MSDVLPGCAPKTGQTTIGVTATQLLAPQSGTSAGVGRCSGGVIVKAPSTNTATVFIGGSGVTAANGFPLAPGDSCSLNVDDPSRIFGIVAAATQPLAYIYL